jgi:HK97 gp10 family phage protein
VVEIDAKVSGSVDADLSRFEKRIKDAVIFSGAAAMARLIYEEVLLNVSPPRKRVVTGNLRDSIYRVYSPERSSEGEKTYRVSYNHKKAPHGHLVEFGTSRAPAKPFIRPALSRLSDAIKAGNARMTERLKEG